MMTRHDIEAVIAALVYAEPRGMLHPGVKETYERALEVMTAEHRRVMMAACGCVES